MLKTIVRSINAQKRRGKLIEALRQQPEQHDQLQQLIIQEDAFNREVLIVVFSTTTAVIHLYYGGVIFILNGLASLTFLAARHLLPKRESYQTYVRDGTIIVTAATILPYFAKYGLYTGFEMTSGMISKLAEIGLIYVLWRDGQAAHQHGDVLVDALAVDAAQLRQSNDAFTPALVAA